MSRPIPEGVELPTTNPTQISTSAVDPKDALIRELVGALIEYRKVFNDGPENCSYADYDHADTVAEAAITLAKTTCPELFKDND